MCNPGGSLMLCRCFLIASAFGPVCGMVGMLGDAPVVRNAPSLSRLVIGAWANAAVVVRSAAVDSAATKHLRMTKPPHVLCGAFGALRRHRSFAHRRDGSSSRCSERRDASHPAAGGDMPSC